jgi:ATP-dependent protease ClpP protease subunit
MAHLRSLRIMNMRNNDWYRITNKGGRSEIHIYDEIGFVGVTANDFIKDLADIKGPIDLHLNTPGGEIFDGIAIYNALKERDVTVFVDSLAASIGSVIAMAGQKVVMARNAQMMIHDGFGMTVGNAKDMRKTADLLDKASDNIADIYSQRTGKPATSWRDLMKEETWFSAQEAVDAGLADEVSGATDNQTDFDLKALGFKGPKAAAQPRCKNCNSYNSKKANYCKQCGTPMKKSAAKLQNADVDNSPWDASKAWHNGTQADDPAAFYAAICAGKKVGDKSTQTAWALPYRYTPSSPPNAAAVRNALARIDQTEGLTNKSEALAKLQKLMKQINPDYEPADIDSRTLTSLFTELLGS